MIQSWSRRECFLHTAKLFRIALLVWCMLHTLLLLPFHATIWGVDAYALRLSFDDSWYAWIFQLTLHPAVAPYYLCFIFAQLLSAGLGIFGIWPRFMLACTYILTLNINSLTGVILDGGNNLSQLLLVYLLLVNTSGRPVADGPWAPWLRAISNAGFVLCQLQVAIVYLTAGLLKSNGHLWQNGMALYYLFQSETYGHPLIGQLMRQWPWLSLIGTYTTLIFQWLFPILIWSRRWRPYLITFGLILHLGIAFGMGLFTFGLVMCLSYLLFVPDDAVRILLASYRFSSPIRVGFDESCGLCQRFARLVLKLDWLGLIRVDGAHQPADPSLAALPYAERITAIQSFSAEQRYQGFATLVQILRRLPVLWPVIPVLLVLEHSGWGEHAYVRIATASWRRSCDAGACSLP
jgi:predicted DCC family thiol-disulfide oxidoreductase YuxK